MGNKESSRRHDTQGLHFLEEICYTENSCCVGRAERVRDMPLCISCYCPKGLAGDEVRG